jgi:hypothetical protein
MTTYTKRAEVTKAARKAMVSMLCIALGLPLAGCVARPQHALPMAFRHCVVTNEAQGFIGCDCARPLVVWDAQLKRKVVYCDGKVQ